MARHPAALNWRHISHSRSTSQRSRPVVRDAADVADREVETIPIPGWKRGFDLLWILLILPLLLFLLPALCCWIKLTSAGPLTFRQTRIGRGGKPFTMIKFRTMKLGSDASVHEDHVTHLIKTNQPLVKLDCDDDRLIRGACLIRMFGLDELPQLVNVMKNEMTIIGPRPCLPCEFKLHTRAQCRRFAVQPGLTGLWQISRTESTTFREMVETDLKYVDHLSAWSDFKIIMKTPVAVVGQCATSALSKLRKSQEWTAGQTSTEISGRSL